MTEVELKQGMDASQEVLFSLCPRKYFYVYEQGLKDEMGLAALFSKHLIHAALAIQYASLNLLLSPYPDLDKLWENYIAEAGEGARMDSFYTLDLAQRALDKYAFDGYLVRDREEFDVVEVEAVKSRRLNDELSWISKPDVVLSHKEIGTIYPLDFKTSKYAPKGLSIKRVPDYTRDILFDRQFLGQVWITRGEGHITRHFKLGVNDITISEQRLDSIPEVLLKEWEEERKEVLTLKEKYRTIGVWPKNAPQACYNFGYVCPFLRLCNVGIEASAAIAEWIEKCDPYAYLKEAVKSSDGQSEGSGKGMTPNVT